MDLTHLIAFGIGMSAAVLKDLLQVFIFNRQMKSLGTQDYEHEMDRMMKATDELNKSFAPNTPQAEDNPERGQDYRGYYS